MMVVGNYIELSGEDIVNEACSLLYEKNDLLGALDYLNEFFPLNKDYSYLHVKILDGELRLEGTARSGGVNSLYLTSGSSTGRFLEWLNYIKTTTPKRTNKVVYYDMETRVAEEVEDGAVQG